MALQALNLLQTVINKNEISDTDILINTIRDYIKKIIWTRKNEGATPLIYTNKTLKYNHATLKYK